MRRLDRPWVKDSKTKKLREASWDEAFEVVASKLNKTDKDKVAALAGDMVDVESVVALKDLMGSYGVTNLECRLDGAQIDSSVREAYVMNSGIAGIEEADAILLVGTFPRWEATMVNARIRKAHLNNNTKIAVIGSFSDGYEGQFKDGSADLTYPYEFLGEGVEAIEALMKARTGFAKTLKEAKKPMVIAGMGAFQRNDGFAVQALLRSMSESFGMAGKNAPEGWNGFNVLHDSAGRVGALDVGFVAKKPFDLSACKFVYLLGADDFVMNQIDKNAFVVYQGHHGDQGAHRADVILPGAAYTEKNALYVNTEGRVQQTKRAVYPPGEAKEDWKILRALSQDCNAVLPYNSHMELRQRIFDEWPHLAQFDVLPAAQWRKFGKEGKFLKAPLKAPIENFYLTNPLARASQTMAKCTEAFLNAQTPIKGKAA